MLMPIPQAQPYDSDNWFVSADKGLTRKDGEVISAPVLTRQE